MLRILLISIIAYSQVYACVSFSYMNAYSVHIAMSEAKIAQIPEYKFAILLDSRMQTTDAASKIALINRYNTVHQKPLLTQMQIDSINALESQKTNFVARQRLCNQ